MPRDDAARRQALGAFLRSARARVTPADHGLPPGVRRRTPGLRREEIAQLCGISTTWYTWIEQGREVGEQAGHRLRTIDQHPTRAIDISPFREAPGAASIARPATRRPGPPRPPPGAPRPPSTS